MNMRMILNLVAGMILICVSISKGQIEIPLPPPPFIPLSHFCEPDGGLPDGLMMEPCSTCENRCGERANGTKIYHPPEPGPFCACDAYCVFYDNCCEDFQTFCPDEHGTSLTLSRNFPSAQDYRAIQCKSIPQRIIQGGYVNSCPSSILVVTKCMDGTQCRYSTTVNDDPNSFVPMYDTDRHIHYISAYCAMCNQASNVQPWGTMFDCPPSPIPGNSTDMILEMEVLDSVANLQTVVQQLNCGITYVIPGETTLCTSGIRSECPARCQNLELINKCETGAQGFVTDGRATAYRNIHCAVCAASELATSSNLSCGFLFQQQGTLGVPLKQFSLTLVFDFDPRRGLTVGAHTTPECPPGQVYVLDEDSCRKIICQSGLVLKGSKCIPEPSKITVILTSEIKKQPEVNEVNAVIENIPSYEVIFLGKVEKVMEMFNISYEGLEVNVNISVTNNSLSSVNQIKCNCDYSTLYKEKNNRTTRSIHTNPKILQFQESISSISRTSFIVYAEESGLLISNIQTYINASSFPAESSQVGQCVWLLYNLTEVTAENGTVRVIATGKTYASGKYEILDTSAIVCDDNLDRLNSDDEGNSLNLVLSIVSLVLVGISIICLTIRIVLQFFITHFKSRVGRLQFQVTLALLFTFIWLIVGPFLVDYTGACTAAAICMAYGFLATFAWMNIIAIDTWYVFLPSSAFALANDDDKSIRRHLILGWGIPLLLVSISLGMEYSDIDDRFIPYFGGSRCWYTHRYAMLLYFGVPIALSMVLNLYFYIHTSINLHNAFKNAATTTKMDSYHFAVYVRLFIMMGITWIFGFISAFTDEAAIDFIFVILNSLQGLFLFISFVCNKRVISEISKKVTTDSSKATSSSKPTHSTQMNNYDVASSSSPLTAPNESKI